jgi:hypothetical protein
MNAKYWPCFAVKGLLVTAARLYATVCENRQCFPGRLLSRTNRLQNRLVHLLRIESEPGGIRLHDRDSTHETLTALTFLLQLLCERADLITVKSLLDSLS